MTTTFGPRVRHLGVICFSVAILLALPVAAQTNVSGSWTGTFSWTSCPPQWSCDFGVQYSWSLNLIQNGNAVTGTAQGEASYTMAGTISGSTLNFQLTATQISNLQDTCTAQLSGGEMSGSCTMYWNGLTGSWAFAVSRQTAQLQITSADVATAQVGSSFTFTPTASGGTPPYTWSVAGNLPPEFTFNAVTGVINSSKVPNSAVGKFAFTYQVMDTLDRIATQDFELTISGGIVITKLEPVQVVYGADALIAGKATAFRVSLHLDRSSTPLPNDIVVNVSFDGNLVGTKTVNGSDPVSKFDSNGDLTVIVNPQFLPTQTGTRTASATATAHLTDQSLESPFFSVKTNVVSTSSWNESYVSVICLLGCGTPDLSELGTDASRMGDFIRATYPFADNAYSNRTLNEPYLSSSLLPGSGIILPGIAADLLGIRLVDRLSNPNSQRTVGIVSHQYFPFRDIQLNGRQTRGINIYPLRAALVEESWTTISAHELGHFVQHSGGLSAPVEEPNVSGELIDGFWVNAKNVAHPDGTPTVKGARCFMNSALGDPNGLIWLHPSDYSALLSYFSQTLQSSRALHTEAQGLQNSKTLLAGGVLSQDGTFNFIPWYVTQTSDMPIFSSTQNGNYSVRVLDGQGMPIYTSEFSPEFVIQAQSDSFGTIPVDAVPFLWEIPYSDESLTLQITGNGSEIARVPLAIKLLHDALAVIPDSSFAGSATLGRTILADHIRDLGLIVRAGAAPNRLEQSLSNFSEAINEYLLDSPASPDPRVFNKVGLLDLFQSVSIRILNTPPNNNVPGDVNGDGKVDCSDVAIIRSSFAKKLGQVGFDWRADLNLDGVVDVRDLAFVSQQLPAGNQCQ